MRNYTTSFALTCLCMTLSTSASATDAKRSLRSRELTVCDRFKACYLVNIKTRVETLLDGDDRLILDSDDRRGYSIRCEVRGNAGAELDFMKFKYNGIVQDEFATPRYMNGDSHGGDWINSVPYLETCGMKTVLVEGHVWSTKCFTKQFQINVVNADGAPCNVPSPIRSPVRAPVKAPVDSPVKAPVRVPVTPPNPAPVKSPVRAPVKSPTSASSDCNNEFVCPSWSERIPGRQCYSNISDCKCVDGYRMVGMQCVTSCANPFGNPCGPFSACSDTPTGISCSNIFLDGCPTGCGFNASCQPNINGPGYDCVCDTGYYNPDPNFAYCAKLP